MIRSDTRHVIGTAGMGAATASGAALRPSGSQRTMAVPLTTSAPFPAPRVAATTVLSQLRVRKKNPQRLIYMSTGRPTRPPPRAPRLPAPGPGRAHHGQHPGGDAPAPNECPQHGPFFLRAHLALQESKGLPKFTFLPVSSASVSWSMLVPDILCGFVNGMFHPELTTAARWCRNVPANSLQFIA